MEEEAGVLEGPSATATAASVTAAACWRYCMHIAYLGTGFVGWQRQEDGAVSSTGHGSVQELMEDAVTSVLGASERINVTGVSRTDAGTHALYQYGFIRLTTELPMTMLAFKNAVNAQLPRDKVVVHSVEVARESSLPGRARSRYKKYVYYLQQGHRPDLQLGRYSWFLGRRIDVERLREGLQFLVGTHDFRPFSQGLQKPQFADKSAVRTIISAKVVVRRHVVFSLDAAECGSGEVVDAEDLYTTDAGGDDLSESHANYAGDNKAVSTSEHESCHMQQKSNGGVPVHFICVELVANGFLRHMVRRIMGTLRPIGEGRDPPDRVQKVLAGEAAPGPSAPSKALWLHRTWLTQEDYNADDAENR